MYIFSKMFEAEALSFRESVRSIFLFVLSLHLNTPLSKFAIPLSFVCHFPNANRFYRVEIPIRQGNC